MSRRTQGPPLPVSTCRHDPELQLLNYSIIDYAEYDGKSNDLHTLDLPKKDYDLVVVNQTLKHVYNPFQCVKNIYDHIKPGGYFFTSVPMINVDHNLPFYYWGINPTGLALMCKSQGFEVLQGVEDPGSSVPSQKVQVL